MAAAAKAAYLGRRAIVIDKPRGKLREDGLDPFFGGPTGLFSKALRDVGPRELGRPRRRGVGQARLLLRARSWLYRCRILQEKPNLKALAGIYILHTFRQISDLKCWITS